MQNYIMGAVVCFWKNGHIFSLKFCKFPRPRRDLAVTLGYLLAEGPSQALFWEGVGGLWWKEIISRPEVNDYRND